MQTFRGAVILVVAAAALGVEQSGRGKDAEILPNFAGTVKAMAKSTLTIETADDKTLDFHLTSKTRYFNGEKRVKAADVKVGDLVSVEVRQAPDASLEAVNVRITGKYGILVCILDSVRRHLL